MPALVSMLYLECWERSREERSSFWLSSARSPIKVFLLEVLPEDQMNWGSGFGSHLAHAAGAGAGAGWCFLVIMHAALSVKMGSINQDLDPKLNFLMSTRNRALQFRQ
jgi:hypothetical protein